MIEWNAEGYRSILESLPTGAYLVDRDRRILLWSDGAEILTGYFRHEAIGRCCADDLLMHCDEQNDVLCGVACPLQGTMHDGHRRVADVFLRHKDGQRVPVRVRAVPVRDAAGAIVGACECFEERAVTAAAVPFGDRDTILSCVNAELLSGRPFGVLSVAIDHLEKLRSRDGPKGLEAIAYAIAQTLANCIGPGNVAGRWSEERFACMVKGCGAAGLFRTGEVLQRLAGLDSVRWWGERLSVTVSVGGAVARDSDTAEEVVEHAEEALRSCGGESASRVIIA